MVIELRWPNTVFKCICLIYNFVWTIYAWAHVFFARVKVNQLHRRVYSHILAKMCAVAMEWGWQRTRLKKNGFCLFFFKSVDRSFIICPLRIHIKSLLSTPFLQNFDRDCFRKLICRKSFHNTSCIIKNSLCQNSDFFDRSFT